MSQKPYIQSRAAAGFTLVELLTVMAIMLVLMALIIPAFPNIGKAANLTNGTASFVDELNAARQSALAMNRSVEVRFYYMPGPTDGTTCTGYRAMRAIICDASGYAGDPSNPTQFISGARPGLVKRLPAGVIVYSDGAASSTTLYTSLLPGMSNSSNPVPTWPSMVSTSQRASTGTETFPGLIPVTYSYAAFQFKPNGSTNLNPLGTGGIAASAGPPAVAAVPGDKWFMSFKLQTDKVQTTKPAINYITVILDPINGRLRTLRP